MRPELMHLDKSIVRLGGQHYRKFPGGFFFFFFNWNDLKIFLRAE